MEFNPDAVRETLLYIENSLNYDNDEPYITHFDIINNIKECKLYDKNDIRYSIEVLLTTNFLNLVQNPVYSVDGELIMVRIKGLTYSGCNFLDDIRKPEIWSIVKKKAKSLGVYSINAIGFAGAELSKALLTDSNALKNFMKGLENIKNIAGI